MPTMRVGPSKKYTANWALAFGKKAVGTPKGAKASAKKTKGTKR